MLHVYIYLSVYIYTYIDTYCAQGSFPLDCTACPGCSELFQTFQKDGGHCALGNLWYSRVVCGLQMDSRPVWALEVFPLRLHRRVCVFPNHVTGNTGGLNLRCENISKMSKRNGDPERRMIMMMIFIAIIRIGLKQKRWIIHVHTHTLTSLCARVCVCVYDGLSNDTVSSSRWDSFSHCKHYQIRSGAPQQHIHPGWQLFDVAYVSSESFHSSC